MTLLAHRGVTARARDNSGEALRAVAEAARKGLPLGIEMDIRAIADGLVLNHDPFEWGLPLFDVPYVTLQAELKADCPIRLGTGLAILRDVPLINLELKEVGTSQRVIETVLQHCEDTGQPLDSFVFISFIPQVVAEIKAIDSRLITGQLLDGNLGSSRPTPDRVCLTLDDEPDEDGQATAETMWKVTDHVGADFLVPHWSRINRRVFELAAERNKQIVPWSVNNGHLLTALLKNPFVAHVVTDFPEMAFPELKLQVEHRKMTPRSDSE